MIKSASPQKTTSGSGSPQWDSRNEGFISPQRLNEMKRQSAQNVYRYENSGSGENPNPGTGTNTGTDNSQNLNSQLPAATRTSSSNKLHKRTASASMLNPRSRRTSILLDDVDIKPINKNQAGDIIPGSTSPPMQPTRQRSVQNLPVSPPVDSQHNDALSASNHSHRSASVAKLKPTASNTSLHPEIRSVVQLSLAHAHKVYYSGPLIRHIERQPDGNRPSKDEGWRDVWAQLGGTTLSIWDMKEIEEASKRGEEVPPSYINVTDAVSVFIGCESLYSKM